MSLHLFADEELSSSSSSPFLCEDDSPVEDVVMAESEDLLALSDEDTPSISLRLPKPSANPFKTRKLPHETSLRVLIGGVEGRVPRVRHTHAVSPHLDTAPARSPLDEIKLLEEEVLRESVSAFRTSSGVIGEVVASLESVAPKRAPVGLPAFRLPQRRMPIRFDARETRPVKSRLTFPGVPYSRGGPSPSTRARSARRAARYHAIRGYSERATPRSQSLWEASLARTLTSSVLRQLRAKPRSRRAPRSSRRPASLRQGIWRSTSIGSQAVTCALPNIDEAVINESAAASASCNGCDCRPSLSTAAYGFNEAGLRSFGQDAALLSCDVDELSSLAEFETNLLVSSRMYWPLKLRQMPEAPAPLIHHVWRKILMDRLSQLAASADLESNMCRVQCQRVCAMLGCLAKLDLEHHESK